MGGAHPAPGIELTGKTLGLIGMGRIGARMLHMCKDGLDMRILVYDPHVSEVPEGVEKTADLDELLRCADVVTLHCLLLRPLPASQKSQLKTSTLCLPAGNRLAVSSEKGKSPRL